MRGGARSPILTFSERLTAPCLPGQFCATQTRCRAGLSGSTAPGKGKGQLAHLLQGSEGRGKHPSLTHTTTWQTRGAGPVLHFHTLTASSPTPPRTVSTLLYCPSETGGFTLPNDATGEGQDQFFLGLQSVRGGVSSVQPYPLGLP